VYVDEYHYEVRDTSNNTFLFDVFVKKTDTDEYVLGQPHLTSAGQPIYQIKSEDNTKIALLKPKKGHTT